jgi:hypothetical protein
LYTPFEQYQEQVGTVLVLWLGGKPPPATELNQSHPDPARKLSTNLYDINHCQVYSE